MPVILGVAGSVGNSNGLIPGTISSVDPTECTVDGASTPILVLTGHPYGPKVGDRVGLEQIGRQYMAFPIDASSTATFPGYSRRTFGDSFAPRLNTQIVPYAELSDPSDSWSYPGFFLDEANIVHTTGLAIEATAASYTGGLYQLPPAYRPSRSLSFFGMNSNGLAHLQVGADGIISASTPGALAASTFINFDEIHFPTEAFGAVSWVDLTSGLQTGWSNKDAAHSVRGWIDNCGDLHIQGWIVGTSSGLTGNALQLPASVWPNAAVGQQIWACPTLDTQGTFARIDITTGGMIQVTSYVGGTATAGITLDHIIIPNVAKQDYEVWKGSPYANSWATFGAPYDPIRIYRNPIGRVYTRGLVKLGSPSVTMGPQFLADWIKPRSNIMASVIAGAGGARIDVLGSSIAASALEVVTYYNSGSNSFVTLCGMTWDTINR